MTRAQALQLHRKGSPQRWRVVKQEVFTRRKKGTVRVDRHTGSLRQNVPESSLRDSLKSESPSVMSPVQPHGLYSPWNPLGQNTGVGSLSLLQGNLPNPGIEPRLPALQADSLQSEPPGKPVCM